MNRETLNQYSKHQLIAMCRAAGIGTGDTARNSKDFYVEALLAHGGNPQPVPIPLPAEEVAEAVAEIAAPTAVKSGDASAQLAALIATIAGGAIDEAKVRAIVADAVAKAVDSIDTTPRRIELTQQGAPVGEIKGEHTHPVFEKVVRLVRARLNVALVGPAGCGKSHLAHQVANALSARRYGELNCTAGASESDLTGFLLPTGAGGAFEYHAVPFVDVFENGGVFMLDEFDAADPNMALVVNAATANGRLNLAKRLGNHHAVRHADCVMMAGLNTFMTGADAMYSARNSMDASTADRWYMVTMDYDPAYEASLWGGKAKRTTWEAADPASCEAEIAQLAAWIQRLRQRATAAKLRRVVSTRMYQKGIAARRAGIPLAEIQADLCAGWTRDELAKVD